MSQVVVAKIGTSSITDAHGDIDVAAVAKFCGDVGARPPPRPPRGARTGARFASRRVRSLPACQPSGWAATSVPPTR